MEHDPLTGLRAEVERLVKRSVARIDPGEVRLVRPRESHGDLAFPCHPLARRTGREPQAVAEDLARDLSSSGSRGSFSAAAGFLNIGFDPREVALATLRSALGLRESYGTHPPTGRRVLVEHTSANPTGPLHVGRARNPIIGDALARLLRAAGEEVATEFYVNDVGKQVATLTWGCLNLPGGASTTAEIVKRYQDASDLLKNKDERVGREVTVLLQRLERGEAEACGAVARFTSIVLKEMEEELAAIGIRFDRFTHESEFVRSGRVRELFAELESRGVVKKDGSALYMDLPDEGVGSRGGQPPDGDHPAPDERFYLTRTDGTSLYSSRDIAYHDDKLRRADACVNVLGEDQKHAFRQLSAAVRALGLAGGTGGAGGKSLEALFYGIVNLPGAAPGTTKKMSTRAGTAVPLRELVDGALRRAREEVTKRRPDLPPGRLDAISSSVAVGAVRYNIVRIQPEKSIVFRLEEALSFEGEAAPFIQYAHARCMSVFRKAKEEKQWSFPEDLPSEPTFAPGDLEKEFELSLLRAIAWLPATILDAAGRRSPHLVAGAAFDIADRFMRYYEHVHFLASEKWRSRLEVVAATKYALAAAMGIVGVPAVEEM